MSLGSMITVSGRKSAGIRHTVQTVQTFDVNILRTEIIFYYPFD